MSTQASVPHDSTAKPAVDGLQVTAKRPFGWRDRVGYMFGDFGNDFTFILQATFFMLFYTNVVGVRPEHVGMLLFGARILDGFTDVGMGILIDRMPVKPGGDKFRRWIRAACVPVAIASALMYLSFVADFDAYGAKIAWMCATYILWGSIAYTAINIPYGSMASVISDDPNHRAELSAWRATGALLAGMAINAVMPMLVYVKTPDGQSVLSAERMTYAAIGCSIAAILCYLLCYVMVAERVPAAVEDEQDRMGIGQMLKAVLTNRALLGLIVAALLNLVVYLFINGMLGYLFLEYFNNGKLQSVAALVGTLPTLVLLVLAPALAKRFGKAEVSMVGLAVAGVVCIIALLLRTQVPAVWIALFAVANFGVALFNFLVWSFITDVIDYQEVQTGSREDATVYSVYSWARKLGQAFAGLSIGWALGLIGYDATAASAGRGQSPEVADSIYTLANIVPGIGAILVAVAIWLLYPLKKDQVEKNARILAERREQAGVVVPGGLTDEDAAAAAAQDGSAAVVTDGTSDNEAVVDDKR